MYLLESSAGLQRAWKVRLLLRDELVWDGICRRYLGYGMYPTQPRGERLAGRLGGLLFAHWKLLLGRLRWSVYQPPPCRLVHPVGT